MTDYHNIITPMYFKNNINNNNLINQNFNNLIKGGSGSISLLPPTTMYKENGTNGQTVPDVYANLAKLQLNIHENSKFDNDLTPKTLKFGGNKINKNKISIWWKNFKKLSKKYIWRNNKLKKRGRIKNNKSKKFIKRKKSSKKKSRGGGILSMTPSAIIYNKIHQIPIINENINKIKQKINI